MTISSLDAARAHVAAALARLTDYGQDSDSIAATLRRWGITGERGKCATCPIANFLRVELAGEDYRGLTVHSDHVSVMAMTAAGPRHVEMLLPLGIGKFVHRFDSSVDAYPDLALA